MQFRHIVIAGNIGVGKSTLVGLLAERLNWTPVYELQEANPYLDEYYADARRWGFHSQIWFLSRRFAQHQELARIAGPVVQDRSIYEDAEVFAAGLHRQGIINERDYATYRQMYEAIVNQLPPPRLVVYLHADVPILLERIAKRARPAERAIRADYLHELAQGYTDWIADWRICPVLKIDTNGLNLVDSAQDKHTVISRIDDHAELAISIG